MIRLVEQDKMDTKKMLCSEVRKEEEPKTLCGAFVNIEIFSFPEEVK